MDKVNLETALTEINQNCSKNFKEALDIAVNLGIDPKKTDQAVRGATNLPHGNGKTYKVAVFAEGEEAKDALDNGADKVGMEDLAEDMKKGELDFDVIIATPATMKVVSPLGQILGPKGLMPNPKSETVTKDVKTAVKNAKAGQIRYKSDKQGIIHTRIGQVGYSEEQVRDNVEAFLSDLKKAKPPSSKGVFISKVSISSTMGKGFDIDLTTLNF
ncbi:50S ribosomal protein L1 [SAR86 cluster bacterium]|jgi:large subunit ribosomal protein L1|nr:50S ribosomal protein L1 [SAR86 cluster bacterium]MEC7786855.1 50S ribosomal protein L1 [Pseudomonadota bacterium]MEC8108624.1 50S ribosomal protein L1 [Pseudomonadota bacterium]MEC8169039.1 50S ribosomal protein L1 [Pseudomonadota bacterium]|tara:strand:+ start:257 stop:901 length:645 start_codon:yes stop_codon:yes gene_type:complete